MSPSNVNNSRPLAASQSLTLAAAGDYPLAVRRKGNRRHGIRMPLQDSQLLTIYRVPHFRRPIHITRDDAFVVRRNVQRQNDIGMVLISAHSQQFPTTGGVPD